MKKGIQKKKNLKKSITADLRPFSEKAWFLRKPKLKSRPNFEIENSFLLWKATQQLYCMLRHIFFVQELFWKLMLQLMNCMEIHSPLFYYCSILLFSSSEPVGYMEASLVSVWTNEYNVWLRLKFIQPLKELLHFE